MKRKKAGFTAFILPCWWIEDSQKAILIGKGGERLKKISTEARLDMEKLFDTKVFLKVWVKVKSGWADDIRFLRELGL